MHLVILGLIVASSASVKMVALVTGSAAVSAPLGGMESTVKSQVYAAETHTHTLKTGYLSSDIDAQLSSGSSPSRHQHCEDQQPRVTLTSVRVFRKESRSEIECGRHKRDDWGRLWS